MRFNAVKFYIFIYLFFGFNIYSFAQIDGPPPPLSATSEYHAKSDKPAPKQGWNSLFKEFNYLIKETNICDTNSFALFKVQLDSNGKVISVETQMEFLKCRKGRNLLVEKLSNTSWDVSLWDFKKNPKCTVLVPADLHYTHPYITRTAKHPLGMQRFYAQIGQEFIYPKVCLEAGISGFVVLQFIVDRDGSISNIQSVNGDSGCEPFVAEAIRVLKKLGSWIPGKQGESYVKMQLKLPIRLEAQ